MDDYDRYKMQELAQRIYVLLTEARFFNEEGQKTRSRELSLVITSLEESWLRACYVAEFIDPQAYKA